MSEIPSPPLLDYGCTPARLSTQRIADLYNSGVKLWTRESLVDIERQLEQSHLDSFDRFLIRGVDGKVVHIKNPFPGVKDPIWKPLASFRDYWNLVQGNIDGPPEALYCAHFIQWRSFLDRDFRGNIQDWQRLFETKRNLWEASITCASFKQQVRDILSTPGIKITKILCFGLGDIARTSPEVYIPPGQDVNIASESEDVHQAMIQHAAALTMTEIAGAQSRDPVRLLSQDPQYSNDSKEFLRNKGFDIVGDFGAGGFGYVDEECLVFAAWPSVPVKQIIADIGRPAVFITLSNERSPFNRFNKPFFDAESPRTREMWLEYERFDFPTSPTEVEDMKGLGELKVFVRSNPRVYQI